MTSKSSGTTPQVAIADTPTRASSAAEPGSVVRLSRRRRVIAQRMTHSLHISAQLTAVQEADLSSVSDARDRVKQVFRDRESAGLTFLAFIAKSVLDVLPLFPQVNASIDDDTQQVIYHSGVHLGIAVDTPGGLVVPVVRDAHSLSLPELARRIGNVAERVRNGSIDADELTGSTFTISNIGGAGSLLDTPIINQPEVAILGTGAVRRLPRVVSTAAGTETIEARPVCYLPLTYDHRLIDGALSGRFLTAVVNSLQDSNWREQLASYEL
ncbi:hypothetical protein CH289_27160 [Rhodococcus sp. RS1C4]|nr:2-oxo acid dehydrogenase subunit E2 [Rhodococcus sp. RS1C4]OZC42674.1 hypothetical protein CH289_27160 [Rhodococcus sp. RS1C4]